MCKICVRFCTKRISSKVTQQTHNCTIFVRVKRNLIYINANRHKIEVLFSTNTPWLSSLPFVRFHKHGESVMITFGSGGGVGVFGILFALVPLPPSSTPLLYCIGGGGGGAVGVLSLCTSTTPTLFYSNTWGFFITLHHICPRIAHLWKSLIDDMLHVH